MALSADLPSLLTCPFCGGVPEFIYRRQFKEWFVKCSNEPCRATCSHPKSDRDEAKTANEAALRWNRNVERQRISEPNMRQV